ncbi:cysteine-rich receptor-like protein kinase 8 [Tanacetum coccineum]
MSFDNTSNSDGTTSSTTDQITSDHPLFLLPNDNPGLVLISKKLTGSANYNSWKRLMLIALNEIYKMKIVNGEFVDAEHYAQINGHKIYQLMNDIVQLKQIDCTVEVYYHKLKGLWNEFDALEALHLCIYVCNCENGKENGEMDQRKRLVQFLLGIDDSYLNIRGQILFMQPLPSVVKAYNMVRQEEKQREGMVPKPATAATFSTYTNNHRPYNNNNYYQRPFNRSYYTQRESSTQAERRSSFRKLIIYGNCNKEGYSKEGCYKTVGYPMGHPLHGKVQPKPYMSQSQEYKPSRIVNIVVIRDEGVNSQAT